MKTNSGFAYDTNTLKSRRATQQTSSFPKANPACSSKPAYCALVTHRHEDYCDDGDNRDGGHAHDGEVPAVKGHGSSDRSGNGRVFFLFFPYREFNWHNWNRNRESHFVPQRLT